MLINKEVSKAYRDLSLNKKATVEIAGILISIQIFEEESKIAFVASVYEGSNYVPQSVRRQLTSELPYKPNFMKTFLKLDEERFLITLHYLGHHDLLEDFIFEDLLMEFASQADEWRLNLDEHDRHDLVHVRVP